MRKKIIRAIIIVLAGIMALLMTGTVVPYLTTRHSGRTVEEILLSADNQTPIEDLLTRKYNFMGKHPHLYYRLLAFITLFDRSMDEYFWFLESRGTREWMNVSLEELDKHMPVQCLRKVDDNLYYAVYQDRKGAYIYLLLSQLTDPYYEGKASIHNSWMPAPKLYRDDFEQLEVRKSTLRDVKRIDPYTKQRVYSGHTDLNGNTFHTTLDGYLVRIAYDGGNVITEIDVNQVDDGFVMHWLLPQDRPEYRINWRS